MTNLASGLVAAGSAAGALAAGAALLRRDGPYLSSGHALAGPDDGDPLPAALRCGLAGLTVPVRPGPHGELFIGPGAPRPGRTLRRLVLSPLFARAQARGGRLRADQSVPFRLAIAFESAGDGEESLIRAYRMLDQQLRDHAALLSRFCDGRLEPGAVTVSVTGIVDVRGLLAGQRQRYAFADGTFDDLGSRSAPPALVPMISEPWHRRFGWDGHDPIPAEERHLLHAMLRAAHDDGRTVRISGLPRGSRAARRAVWAELGAAGVDVIADTDLRGLAAHLRRHPILPLPPVARGVVTARRAAPTPYRAAVSHAAQALSQVNKR